MSVTASDVEHDAPIRLFPQRQERIADRGVDQRNDELRNANEARLPCPGQADRQRPLLAHQLIEALADEWNPEKYKDTFQENLKKLIEAKLEGGEVAAVEKPKKLAPVVDLMAALKQSLAQMEGKKKPAATIKAEPGAAAKSRRGRG